jgi:opacity protein-like surface antigen
MVRPFAVAAMLLLLTTLAFGNSPFSVGVAVGAAVPNDEFSELYQTGYGGLATFAYAMNPGVALTVASGMFRWNVDNGAINDRIQDPPVTVSIAMEAPLTMYPLVIGVAYYPAVSTIKPYFHLTGGIYFLNLQTSGTITVQDIPIPLEPRTKNWSEFGLSVGVGVDVPLGKRISLNADAKYNSVNLTDITLLDENDSPYGVIQTSASRFFTIFGGIRYRF